MWRGMNEAERMESQPRRVKYGTLWCAWDGCKDWRWGNCWRGAGSLVFDLIVGGWFFLGIFFCHGGASTAR